MWSTIKKTVNSTVGDKNSKSLDKIAVEMLNSTVNTKHPIPLDLLLSSKQYYVSSNDLIEKSEYSVTSDSGSHYNKYYYASFIYPQELASGTLSFTGYIKSNYGSSLLYRGSRSVEFDIEISANEQIIETIHTSSNYKAYDHQTSTYYQYGYFGQSAPLKINNIFKPGDKIKITLKGTYDSSYDFDSRPIETAVFSINGTKVTSGGVMFFSNEYSNTGE